MKGHSYNCSIEEYEKYAEKNGMTYEVLELSFDNVPAEKRRWYEKCGRVTSIHGAFIDVNPASGDGLFRELSEKRYDESCRLAVDCGAKSIVFHSTCFPFLRGAYLEQWADKSAAFYTKLAEKYPTMDIFIENSPDIDPGPIKELLKLIKAPNIGFCLDIGHVNYSQAPLEEWCEELGDRIGYVHLSDNMGTYDDHLALGDGTVDWKKAFSLFGYLPGDTPVTLEVGGLEGIKRSFEFMTENGFFGGAK